MSGCRIGKVKMKGGAEIIRLPIPHRDELQRGLMDLASHFTKSWEPGELHGYILIAWGADKTQSIVQIDKATIVHVSSAPAFAAEEVRRALVRQGAY